jgi:hypothetical protein
MFEDEEAIDRGSRDRRGSGEHTENLQNGRSEDRDVWMGGLWDENDDEVSGRETFTQPREEHQVGDEQEVDVSPQQVVDGIGGAMYAGISGGEEEETHDGMEGNNLDDVRDAGEFLEFIGAWIRDETISRHQIAPGSYDPGPVQNHVTRMEESGLLQMRVHQWIDREEQANHSSTSGLEETQQGRDELVPQGDAGQQHQQVGEISTSGLVEAKVVEEVIQSEELVSGRDEGRDSNAERQRIRVCEWRRNKRQRRSRASGRGVGDGREGVGELP